MNGKTHKMIGLAVGLTIANKVGVNVHDMNQLLPYSASLIIGAYSNDIDHAGSTLGSKIPILPHLLKHRGFTHSLMFLALAYFIGITLSLPLTLISGFLIGASTHIVSDILTPAGVQLFFPFQQRVRFPIVTSKTLEMIILAFCTVYIIYLGFDSIGMLSIRL